MAKKKLDRIQQIELVLEHDRPMASSLQIAKHFGKPHYDVLRAIRDAIAEIPKDFCDRNFAATEESVVIPHSGGIRKDPAYMLTKDGFAYVCMGFTGKEAARWKVRYVEAFARMENRLRQTALEKYPWPVPESSAVVQVRTIKILRAMLAHWANLDSIPIKAAEFALCLHLGIRRLEDCLSDAEFRKALDFLLRARFQPFNEGERATEDQLTCIRLIAEGCSQFKAFRDGDLYGYLNRVYGIAAEDFENLSAISANKIIVAMSSLFFQFWGQSEYLSHFEDIFKVPGRRVQ